MRADKMGQALDILDKILTRVRSLDGTAGLETGDSKLEERLLGRKDIKGRVPLHPAAQGGYLEAVRRLYQAKMDQDLLSAKDIEGP